MVGEMEVEVDVGMEKDIGQDLEQAIVVVGSSSRGVQKTRRFGESNEGAMFQ